VSPLLIALLGVLLVPLFLSTWRTSLLGLACQGFLMAWIAWVRNPAPGTAGEWLTLADLVLVRGLWAPLALRQVLRARNAPARNDVIPPNLLSWTLALGLVLTAFNASEALVPETGEERTLVAVALAGLLLAFLVLATQSGPFSQMIGVLRFENAIALFELGGPRHHEDLPLQAAQIAIVVASVGLYRWYLGRLSDDAADTAATSAEEPTL